jgi:hypothetical protein
MLFYFLLAILLVDLPTRNAKIEDKWKNIFDECNANEFE